MPLSIHTTILVLTNYPTLLITTGPISQEPSYTNLQLTFRACLFARIQRIPVGKNSEFSKCFSQSGLPTHILAFIMIEFGELKRPKVTFQKSMVLGFQQSNKEFQMLPRHQLMFLQEIPNTWNSHRKFLQTKTPLVSGDRDHLYMWMVDMNK